MPTLNHPIIGARFNIGNASSDEYGMEFWRIVWGALNPTELYAVWFYEGDTEMTLNGSEEVYCIAFKSADRSELQKLRSVLEANDAFRRVSAQPMFIEGPECEREPLMNTGHIDGRGNFSDDAFRPRNALAQLKGLEPEELMDPDWRFKHPFQNIGTTTFTKERPWWKFW